MAHAICVYAGGDSLALALFIGFGFPNGCREQLSIDSVMEFC
jgi:hypothetical protein